MPALECPQCKARSLADFHMLWGCATTAGRARAKAQLSCKHCGKIFTWKSDSSEAGTVLARIHANPHTRGAALKTAA